jgi:signal peptidase II
MRYRLLLAVAAAVAALDAITKAAAAALSHWMPVSLPGGWALQVAHNSDGFLGIFAGTTIPHVFAIAAIVQFSALLFLHRRQPGRLWAVALGLMLGGAGGNLGEYQVSGYVMDWIRPPQPNVVFDLADVAATCGDVLLLALLIATLHTSRVRTRAAVTR